MVLCDSSLNYDNTILELVLLRKTHLYKKIVNMTPKT